MKRDNPREKMIATFSDTMEISNSFVLAQRTRQSMMLTQVYGEGFISRHRQIRENGEICFLSMTSFDAARTFRGIHPTARIAVLNFANPVEPGGGVRRGATAQEECLCRSSNLYSCLAQEKVRNEYYSCHTGSMQVLSSDRVVYSPDVTVFKSDDALPVILSVEKWMQVDILTCAAPFYPGLHDRTDAFLLNLYRNRVKNIFECAIANRVDIIVLGAFGCGAFRNPAYQMAQAFCEIIEEEQYLSLFSVIAFAIPQDGGKSSQNLRVFQNYFSQSCMKPYFRKDLYEDIFYAESSTQESIKLPSGRILKGENLEKYKEWRKGNPYYGKSFSILGDSISTFEKTVPDGYSVFYQSEMREKSGVREVEDTWWSQAVRFMGGRLLVDNAWSGSLMTPLPGTDRRFPSGCSKWRAGGLHLGRNKPDVILVFLGFNDWGNAVPVYPGGREKGIIASLRRLFKGKKEMEKRLALPPTFYEAYEDTLNQICRYYPKAEVWCCTLGGMCIEDSPQWLFPEAFAGIPIGQYNDVIRTLAQRYGAGIIDFAKSERRFQTMDGSHPTAQGMRELSVETIFALTGKENTGTFLQFEKTISNVGTGESKTEVLADYERIDKEKFD